MMKILKNECSFTLHCNKTLSTLESYSEFPQQMSHREKKSDTYADSLLETENESVLLAKSGKKFKRIATEDPAVQLLPDLRKGYKESRLESIRQEIQASKGEGSSVARDGEFEDFSDTNSHATASSSWSDTDKDDDKDDAKNSNMGISDDDSNKDDDDVAEFRVFMYDLSNELPKFTPISPAVTCSSMKDYTNLLNDQPENELMVLLSRPVFTDAQTTFTVANPEGNPKVTSYLSSASEVPFGTNVDVQATEFVLHELFVDAADHQVSSPPATTTHKLITNPQQRSIQAKAKKLLEVLSTINVPEAIKEFVQATVLTKMKKRMPKHVPKAVAIFVKPRINNTVLEVMKNNQINLFTSPSTTTTDDLSEQELKIKLYNRINQN
ncbi:hypothetical protein Tco_1449034 [Tanacetum coccineum]